ncbi:hypothetical protein [Nocardia sp. XZ_19_369]|uniref:hypothetical protein n=1 Tax=Nocardia sp. XZ_19_369 TaxID=2769487 RepID=UPI00188E1606|nr:hypothetical protein [Nocardia sp. XZ_19_369]
MNRPHAFTLTLAPVRPCTIDTTALAAWAATEVPYYQILDPDPDSLDDDLPGLLHDAIARGVFIHDPALDMELHTDLFDDPGYIITVRNHHDPAPRTGISSQHTPLIPADAQLSLADAIGHYLRHIRDTTNTLLGHPTEPEPEAPLVTVDPDAPLPPLTALERGDVPLETEFGNHPTISLLLEQHDAFDDYFEWASERIEVLTAVTTALTSHRDTLTPATPEHTELDTLLTELTTLTADLDVNDEDATIDAIDQARARLERHLHHAITAARR